MATLEINIPNGLIQSRIKPAIEESYVGDWEGTAPVMDTNEDVMAELKKIVENQIKSFIKNKEYKKEKRTKIKEIAIDEVDLT